MTRPAHVAPLDSHLGYWLRFVSNHVSQAFRGAIEARGVTVAEWVVLRALLDAPGVGPSQLAEVLGLTRSAVSKLVDRLAAKHLLSVHPVKDDRRCQTLALTVAGRRLVPILASIADNNDRDFFAPLSAQQRSDLHAMMRQLVEHHQFKSTPVD